MPTRTNTHGARHTAVAHAVMCVAPEAGRVGGAVACVRKYGGSDRPTRRTPCRRGVVSVAIVVRTARTTASVPTLEPMTRMPGGLTASGHLLRPGGAPRRLRGAP
ncbi:hypothetical protein HMPREF1550_02667 [Actinomyces sp. oral taxon 877 str. F0543]|nr:hypothetical protein HMPREF1550_02667 [Actinomyces sp. oral taxon 877 str. F0543]